MNRRERLLNQLLIAPRVPEIDERRKRFYDINTFISQNGGWMTSFPGAREMTFDARPGSPLPEQLTALGYIVEKTGESQRILPHAVTQKFEIAPDGTLVAPTENSSRPTSLVVTNAGLAVVEQFDLRPASTSFERDAANSTIWRT